MSVGEKEQLNIKLQGRFESDHTFQWYQAFDVSETQQMDGKEDLIGNRDSSNIQWYDDNGKETQKSAMLCDAVMTFAESLGIKISKVADLGGARGVSKSGAIDLLDNVAKNDGLFNTLCHELSHELLHQRFLSNKNPELKNYFIGTSQGRGKVEQQAELSAWIILKNYDYDMPTNLNYIGIWGADEKNAPFVFDTVSSVASYIVNGIDKQLNNLNESKRNMKLHESRIPSGLDISRMCGCEKQYLNGKREIEEGKKIKQYLKEEMSRFYKSLLRAK